MAIGRCACVTFLLVAVGVPICPAAAPCASSHWQALGTDNFQIFKWPTAPARHDDVQLRSICEETRSRLSNYWFGDNLALDPKCDVVLYPTDASYCRAVGAGSAQSVASTLIGKDCHRSFARIELRANRSDWETSGLPHELTHVLFAQRFRGHQLPAWINEGTALLADPAAKQATHLHDFYQARARGRAPALAELFAQVRAPGRSDWPMFYGQSLSLTQFLVNRKTPQAFVRFVEKSLSDGYPAALEAEYQIDSVRELERLWSAHVDLARESASRRQPRLERAERIDPLKSLGRPSGQAEARFVGIRVNR